MSLRPKMSVLLALVLTLLTGSSYLVQRYVVLPGFMNAERAEAQDDLGRCTDAIKRDVEHLAGFTRDWAAWDDTYAFVEDGNQGYITANLAPTTFTNNHLTVIAFVRNGGKLVWGQVYDCKVGKPIEAPELLKSICDPTNGLATHAQPGAQLTGLLTTELGLMLFASQAIVQTNNQGPVHGALVMGRLLDAEAIAELGARTRVAISLRPVSDPQMAADEREALTHLSRPGSTWLQESSPKELRGYTVLRDVHDQPALLMQAHLPRTISQRGLAAVRIATWFGLVGGAAILLLVWFMVQFSVVRPLTILTRHAVRIGAEADLQARLNLKRSDEIGVLAGEFDRMVAHLAEYRAQVIAMARQAGMAEVATDVLHNVGNVLNSVNVSADAVTGRLRDSEIPNLNRAAEMIVAHQDDLPAFLTQDARGRQLPAYLVEASKFLATEQEAMLAEMKTLTASLDHIRQVVVAQQSLAGSQQVIETVDAAGLVNEAMRMTGESFRRHHIKLVQQVAVTGPMLLERHRVLEILVNLLNNAKEALKCRLDGQKRIVLAMETLGDGPASKLRVTVEDNGVGISAENLSKVFTFGFTTRKDGHGFGLHAAANAAQQMGGSLTAQSEGEGKGAKFTLEIPVTHQEVAK